MGIVRIGRMAERAFTGSSRRLVNEGDYDPLGVESTLGVVVVITPDLVFH